MYRATVCCVVLSALSLSGCSSGGTSFSSDFRGLVDEGNRLATRASGFGATPNITPPAVGNTATYDGVVFIADNINTDTVLASSVHLDADFVTPSITGTAANFYERAVSSGATSQVPGQLDFTGTPTVAPFPLNANGTVRIDGADRLINGALSAQFLGPNAEMISASGAGIGVTGGLVDVTLAAD